MKYIRSYLTKRRIQLIIPMLVYLVFYTLVFHFTETHYFGHYLVLDTRLDEMIPFCEFFVFPYLSWFAFVPFGAALALYRDEEEYKKLCYMLCIGMTIFLMVSVFFPNCQNLRPTVMPRDNICTRLTAFIYAHDTPTGIFPSIHVYNSLCVMIWAGTSSMPSANGRKFRNAIYIWGVLIILSTMFLKQHSVLDVSATIVMAAVFQPLVYRAGQVENKYTPVRN